MDADSGTWRKLIWLAAFMLPAFWFAYLQRDYQGDDAMIVLRYVQNLIAGEGWVFNPGETVQASTSPLNTLLLLIVTWVCGDAVSAQVFVQGLSVGLAAWFAMRLFEHKGFLSGLFGGLCVLTLPLFITTQGLETAPFACLLLASTFTASIGRVATTSVLLGLLYLVRPDGILMIPILFGGLWLKAHRRGELLPVLGRSLGPASFLIGAWSLWSWLSFGSPFPSTLGAKLAQRESGLWGESFFRELRHSLDGMCLHGPELNHGLLIAFFVVATVVAIRGRLKVWPVLVFAILQSLAYAILNPPYYHWYGMPLHLGIALSVVVVFAVVFAAAPRGWRWCAAILPLSWLPLCLANPLADTKAPPKMLAYRTAARSVREIARPGETLAVFEVGTLGYHLPNLRILDLCGLITPEGQGPLSRGETTWYLARQPDYILFHEPVWPELEAPSLSHPEFAANYRMIEGFSPGSGLRLYRRR